MAALKNGGSSDWPCHGLRLGEALDHGPCHVSEVFFLKGTCSGKTMENPIFGETLYLKNHGKPWKTMENPLC
jgi:hypothetical protein